MKSRCPVVFLFAAAVAVEAAAGRIAVQQDHWSALYRAGEEATFRVNVADDSGCPVRTGKAKWTLDNFGSRVVGAGEIDLARNNPFKVRGRLDREGFLRLTVASGTNRTVWSVGYDVERIRQARPRPADFDQYWADEKARLAKIPLDPKCERLDGLSTARRDVYRISFATFNDRRVYGFMAVPKAANVRPLRCRVRICDAGGGAVGPWELDDDEVTVIMNVHFFEPPRDAAAMRARIARAGEELARKLGYGKLKYYAHLGIARSREDYYFHDAMLGIARAYDWLAARPFVDGSRMVYFGSSQGGGFGLATVYLNPRFSRTCFAVPSWCGQHGTAGCDSAGALNLIGVQENARDRAAADRFAAYFEGANFAAGIRIPTRFIVGFADTSCIPPNVYAAYNACAAKDKAIVNAVGAGHVGFIPWIRNNSDKPTWLDYNAWLGRKPTVTRFETDALKPFRFLNGGEIPRKYLKPDSGFFGCPSVAASRGGRLWCSMMLGDRDGEGDANYVAVVTSGDGGRTWSAPVTVIDADGPLRALDTGLWTDPDGRVRLFWTQIFSFWDGRAGLFCAYLADAESSEPKWLGTRRFADGYIKNKPTALSTGEWLFPIEFMPYDRPLWGGMFTMLENDGPYAHPECGDTSRMMGVWISRDKLASPLEKGGIAATDPKRRDYPENMVVELRDGRLWMLGRTGYGIGESYSSDRGRSWSAMVPSRFAAPNARFYLGRLASGALILVKNGDVCLGPGGKGAKIPRNVMAAWISDDEGKTWSGGLKLDARRDVSYPDVAETPDGFIHCVHDHSRMGAKEILHHRFTEADVRAGRLVTPGSRLGDLVNAYAKPSLPKGAN